MTTMISIKQKTFLFVLLYGCCSFNLLHGQTPVYPFGDEFGFGLYALYEDFTTVGDTGWHYGHTYGEAPVSEQYFQDCSSADLGAMGRLAALDSLGERWPLSESEVEQQISLQADQAGLVFWDIPEELRYWIDNEFEILGQYTEQTRLNDPLQRPNYMYIPGHYDAEGIENYVPYLDIIPASCYPSFQEQPRIYVRWSIERTRAAIVEAGHTEGKNYLADEKSIYAILELFEDGVAVNGTDLRHDFWLALACDVSGVNVFSHF